MKDVARRGNELDAVMGGFKMKLRYSWAARVLVYLDT